MRRAVLSVLALAVTSVAAGCGTTIAYHPESAPSAPPQPPAPHLSASARAGINHTLDLFVRNAVERRAPASAYALASPMMRSSQTHAQWNAGTLPVPPFPARGRTFHAYTVVDATPRQASLQMILQSRHPKQDGAELYTVRLSRHHRVWQVDWFTPTAAFAAGGKAPSLLAEPDLAPSPAGVTLQPKHHADLIMLAVLAVLFVPALITLALVANTARRRRRLRAATGSGDTAWDEAWDEALRGRGR
jgi:hypothetical protein